MTADVGAEIRRVLNEVGRLPLDANELDDRADLYLAGMSSHASVDVMIELEDTFGIEFPAEQWIAAGRDQISAVYELKRSAPDRLRRPGRGAPSAGQRLRSNPCVLNRASTIRSWPKPRHAVWATSPSASSTLVVPEMLRGGG